MASNITIFKYKCSCGTTDFLQIKADMALCNYCDAEYPVSPTGVIVFNQEKNKQKDYFDKLYLAGYSHAKHEFNKDCTDPFLNCVERAESLLKLCGFDLTPLIENLSFLDVACGAGWVTAGIMQNKKILNCRCHAFDISLDGLEILARFEKNIKSSNYLEMSVQNAESMKFGDSTFDVIIGSSILHHIDDYETFLSNCRRILKPNGVAIFGEPFAIGYSLGAAALLIAQKDLGTHYQEIENFYTDIAYRVKSPRNLLINLVDKHLFFQSQVIPLIQRIGFSSIDFISPETREYYRDSFINSLLLERGISDTRLAERANAIYRIFYDIFDAENYVHSITPFGYLVMRP
jgi:ubiquinone/menaquinone biosynthesis C-methylase UbiE